MQFEQVLSYIQGEDQNQQLHEVENGEKSPMVLKKTKNLGRKRMSTFVGVYKGVPNKRNLEDFLSKGAREGKQLHLPKKCSRPY